MLSTRSLKLFKLMYKFIDLMSPLVLITNEKQKPKKSPKKYSVQENHNVCNIHNDLEIYLVMIVDCYTVVMVLYLW